jgi:hypothetical protein
LKSFNGLSQPEILALAIGIEEEDGRIYAGFRGCQLAHIDVHSRLSSFRAYLGEVFPLSVGSNIDAETANYGRLQQFDMCLNGGVGTRPHDQLTL